MLAQNPALSGLGTLCALGVFWCLVSSVLFALPLYLSGRNEAKVGPAGSAGRERGNVNTKLS
jgi:hypothetical protein